MPRPDRDDHRGGGDPDAAQLDPARLDPAPLDAALRAALEPDPRAVRRVLAAARNHPAPAPRQRWLIAAAATTAAGALVAVLWLRPTPPTAVPTPPSPPAPITISNLGGPLTVTVPSGSSWIILDRSGDAP